MKDGASQWVEAGLEQAELIAFGVGQDMPLLLPCLADVGRARTKLQKAASLRPDVWCKGSMQTIHE
ncbi:hypothetical protein GCM10023176_22810 [Micromonospora coerulea]|uniref:Uncharacterized protein n=1 Tax=Micromonospora coerulea TaxID=47856 RepID=A0ABP8SFR3_9ACTN